jgi:peptidoglycan/xylan/chitin deacetylase (PgdA/CDA1 family)
MHDRRWRRLAALGLGLLLQALPLASLAAETGTAEKYAGNPAYAARKNQLVARFGAAVPRQWGEVVTGVKTRLATSEKVIALTMDACGSDKGMGFDAGLLAFLEREQVAATLFINARWIGPNREAFTRLAANPLFEIANHGLRHKPASVTGRSAYTLEGTRNVAELVDEIELGAARLEAMTGRRPGFFRAGTAYYDEVAVQVANALGQEVAGFSILGDKGATYTRSEVRSALLSATAGDIIIVHMNHPESGTRAGVMDAIPELKRRGFRFVRLSEYPLR